MLTARKVCDFQIRRGKIIQKKLMHKIKTA